MKLNLYQKVELADKIIESIKNIRDTEGKAVRVLMILRNYNIQNKELLKSPK